MRSEIKQNTKEKQMKNTYGENAWPKEKQSKCESVYIGIFLYFVFVSSDF